MIDIIKNKLKNNDNLFKKAQKIHHFMLKVKFKSKQILFSPFLLFPIKNNKIFIVSYYGQGYGDSAKSIVEELKMRNSLNSYKIIWAIDDKKNINNFPMEVKKVKYGGMQFYYHMSTSKIWIDNSRKEEVSIKRREQHYIQLWHGGISLKKIEKDAENKLSTFYIEKAKLDSKIADIMISNSKFQTKLIKTSFWFDGPVLEVGTPRVDRLINTQNDNYINKIRKDLNISVEDRVVLYAPTFRNSHSTRFYIQDYEKILNSLSGNTTIMVRMHPNMKSEKVLFENKKIIDVTNYPDMYDLMIASDILITDYSSSMFEFSFMKKPVFLYTKDFSEYVLERGTYFDLGELPFVSVKSEEELVDAINNHNHSQYIEKLLNFTKSIGLVEKGQASKEVVNYILNVMAKKSLDERKGE